MYERCIKYRDCLLLRLTLLIIQNVISEPSPPVYHMTEDKWGIGSFHSNPRFLPTNLEGNLGLKQKLRGLAWYAAYAWRHQRRPTSSSMGYYNKIPWPWDKTTNWQGDLVARIAPGPVPKRCSEILWWNSITAFVAISDILMMSNICCTFLFLHNSIWWTVCERNTTVSFLLATRPQWHIM